MKSEKYPIIINGQGYEVCETFAGSPAIYRGVSFTHKGHITDEPEIKGDTRAYQLEEDDIIIIAKKSNKI